jgi:hypothetical protein
MGLGTRNMRRAGALALLATTCAALSPTEARAESYQTTTAIVAGSVFGAVDLFFISYDLVKAEQGRSPGRTAVYLELMSTTLQLASGLSMVAMALQSDQRLQTLGVDRDLYLPVGAVLATVAVPLLAHGFRNSSDRQGTGMHALRIVPARVGDAHASGPGLMLAGVF